MRVVSYISVLALLAAGCASQVLPGDSPSKAEPDTAGKFDGKTYVLSPEEEKLDCKKLAGRMQLRILQVRDAGQRPTGSSISQGIQSVVTPVFGGTSYGASPSDGLARDRAMLEAYNARLKAKNCQPFDLDKELTVQDVKVTPRPVPKS